MGGDDAAALAHSACWRSCLGGGARLGAGYCTALRKSSRLRHPRVHARALPRIPHAPHRAALPPCAPPPQERAGAEDFDDEEREALEEENAAEDELFDQIQECISSLLKTFKAAFLPYLDSLMPLVCPGPGPEEPRRCLWAAARL